jgi:hypothetical protein
MYAFQSRVPLDHVLAFVALVRSEDRNFSEGLKLVGAITGELGALLGDNFSTADVFDAPATIDGCCASLDSLNLPSVQAEPNFDPTPWIPIILKLIELWLSRRS